MKFSYTVLCFALLCVFQIDGQVILNAYAKVSAINAGATTLTVTNVNETSHTFTVGGDIIIMQMQDNCIGTNTTNATTFGNLSTIANAGRYEIRKIASRLPATGTPTSITLDFALTYTFNTDANSSVQVVTFRDLGANYTTTANITGLAWDGNVGGIIAIQVTNTLTLNHRVSADFIGFRRGSQSSAFSGPICSSTESSVFISNSTNYGWKGEGVYKNSNTNFNNARMKIINGGGGGGHHNGGGGGGGNYSNGGQGGNGYNNCTTNPNGGVGGISLNSVISTSRIFMGGGGGGGQQNNTAGLNGGNGGGIVLIKANTLATNTICSSSIRITSNGETTLNCGNDGAGGGGAGGSILMQIANYNINPSCTLTLSANGGNGGNSTSGEPHGGGGGGGQGVIIYSVVQPTLNVTSTTTNGTPGTDNSGGVVTATGGGGTNNTGIISNSVTPLPIDLVSFSVNCNNVTESVKIEWITATEKNNDFFLIEKSTDALNWIIINQTKGSGNSYYTKKYLFEDYDINSDFAYYRLTQVDFDQQSKTFQNIAYVENCQKTNFDFDFFPNPAQEIIYLKNTSNANVTITNVMGQELEIIFMNSNELDISSFINGIYFIKITDKTGKSKTKKFVKNML